MTDSLIRRGRARYSATSHPLRYSPLAAALAMALSAPMPALAQQRADEQGTTGTPSIMLPVVTVTGTAVTPTTEGTHSYTTDQTTAATGLPMSLRDTPQAVSVVTRQRMDDQQMNSITDVLRNSTGISSYSLDGDGGRVSFYARGFEITNFQYDWYPHICSAQYLRAR
ncbi:TonB-dependent receptor plug domain-containing protein [Xanthomonas hyacinthi]|nr:TonB-dependent receptor plug domain-containing protein [Xanthomonas hyacinthi]